MPDPTTPAKPTPPVEKLDPFVANLMKSFEKALTPSEDTPINPISDIAAPITLSDAVDLLNVKKKAAPAPEENEPENTPTTTPSTPPTTPPTTEPIPPKQVVKKKPLPEPPSTTPQLTVVPPAEKPITGLSAEDVTYVDGLTLEQKEEIEIAQFADAHGHPGKLTATLKYFRDLDKLIEEKPELTADSEDFIQFTNTNAPKYAPAIRKKLEREMIVDQATSKVRQELAPSIEQQQRKSRELELKPEVDAHVDELVTKMSAPEIGNAEKGILPISAEVSDYIREHGYDKAVKKFRVETPIVMGTINAQRIWDGIENGTLQYNPNDKAHQWLISMFLNGEGQRMKQLPQKDRMSNGKEFLTLVEYASEYAKDPAGTNAKFYTFNSGMVSELLAANAVLSVDKEIKDLEESGFKYERKTAKTAPIQQTDPAPTPATGSPVMGGRSMPGAVELPKAQPDARAKYFNNLLPEGAKMAGIS